MRLLPLLLLAACGGGGSVDIMGRTFDAPNVGMLLQHYGGDFDGDGEEDDGMGVVTAVATSFDDPCEIVRTNGPPAQGWGQFITFDATSERYLDVDWSVGILVPGFELVSDDDADISVLAHANEVENAETLFDAGMPAYGAWENTFTLDAVDLEAGTGAFAFEGAWTYATETGGETVSVTPEELEVWTFTAEQAVICEPPEQ